MNEAPTYQPIVLNSESIPKTPKITVWDWIKFYVWNFFRKPLVWKRQKELINIFDHIKDQLQVEILPELWQRRFKCPMCRDAYLALKPQIFLSQIELILKQMACEEHSTVFSDFLLRYGQLFRKSDDLAMWINGFKR